MTKKQGFFTIMGGRVKMEFGPYNPTSDAVWLAAFVDTQPKTVLDVGTGTGAVALCLMARIDGIKMTAIDVSDEMLAAAKKNFELNGKTADFISADILSWKTNKTFDLVITNPPYFRGMPAAHNAHHNADLTLWTRKCIARTRPNGTFATIVDAAACAPVIAEISRHCGDIKILPLFSNKNTAERVLLSALVGRAAHTTIFSGLPMNCDAVLRDGCATNDIISTGQM